MTGVPVGERVHIGVQAGLWGYPLATPGGRVPQLLSRRKALGHNSVSQFDDLKTAADRFVVTPNNLTIDATRMLDLVDGPVVLHVPTSSTTAGSSCRSATPSTTSS